ncbi:MULTISPECIES: hypothetical protein [unclassified Saccharothrix]
MCLYRVPGAAEAIAAGHAEPAPVDPPVTTDVPNQAPILEEISR